MNYILALVPALCFGMVPCIVTRVGGRPTQQQMVTSIAVLLFALCVYCVLRPTVTPALVAGSAVSGLLWALGSVLQYASYAQMGSGRAFALQTGIQLVLNAVVGISLFGEWGTPRLLIMGFSALALIVVGAILSGTANDGSQDVQSSDLGKGLMLSVLASISFVAYSTVPRFVGASGSAAVLPQAAGVVAGAFGIGFLDWLHRGGSSRGPLIEHGVWPCLVSGFVFALGNISLIYSNQLNGIAIGFTLSQLAVVVSTLMSIVVLREITSSRALRRCALGVCLIVAGAVLVGLTKM